MRELLNEDSICVAKVPHCTQPQVCLYINPEDVYLVPKEER
jgi:hypothetical protein